MRTTAAIRLAGFLLSCMGVPALAQQTVTYKNDQFDADIATAAGQIAGIQLAVQPGFAQGEGFGSVFRPAAADYPVRLLGLDMVLAGPPQMAGQSEANAMLELWAIGAGPAPSAKLWEVSTADLFDPVSGQTGIPLMGNVAWSVDFDYSDPLNHPPEIQSGDFAVIIRYADPARDLQTEWGTMQCMSFPEFGMCGCQEVAPILDQATTAQANLMHILTSQDCTGQAGSWNWANAIGVTGDFVIRVRAEIPGGCTPDCTARECGPDPVCGASCGTCPVNEECDADGVCQPVCVPDCTGKECGDDGCGGSCGACAAPEVCILATGQCEACAPDCTGKACGDDGCGGECGQCPPGESCGPDHQCHAQGCTNGELRCQGEVVEVCAAGVWQTVLDCGTAGQRCLAGACVACLGGELRCQGEVVEVCVSNAWQVVIDCAASGQECVDGACRPICTPDCAGRECGDDGCGGSCGACGAGESCDAGGQCVGCTPDCTDRECGDDGCGGSCGACPAGEVCSDAFACVEEDSGAADGCGCGATGGGGGALGLALAVLLLWRRRARA